MGTAIKPADHGRCVAVRCAAPNVPVLRLSAPHGGPERLPDRAGVTMPCGTGSRAESSIGSGGKPICG